MLGFSQRQGTGSAPSGRAKHPVRLVRPFVRRRIHQMVAAAQRRPSTTYAAASTPWKCQKRLAGW